MSFLDSEETSPPQGESRPRYFLSRIEAIVVPNVVKMRCYQLAEFVRSRRARSMGWFSILKEVAFQQRIAVVVEQELSEVRDNSALLANSGLEMVDVDKEMLSSGTYSFAVPVRYLKAINHLGKGHRGQAIARDHVIVGDMWYYGPEAIENPDVLKALRRFGFDTWNKEHAFTFDIFVAPPERKGGASAAFQNCAMLSLRSKGYTKGLGVYHADDLSAYWCTRVINNWKELRAVRVTRFFLFLMLAKEVPLRRKQSTREVLKHESQSAGKGSAFLR